LKIVGSETTGKNPCAGRKNVSFVHTNYTLPHKATNKDGSTVVLHLVCSDLTGDYDTITTTYKKRWKVEVFHKSLKSNANLAKSPTRTIRTQSNHVFMSVCAAFKLECLSIKNKLNPFALCRKLLINASRTAYAELQQFMAIA
jgi:Transposase DDE domain